MKTTTTNEWIDLICDGQVDLSCMPDQMLRDLIGVLEMRQEPIRADACVSLFAAAVCQQIKIKKYIEARANAERMGASLDAWTDEQLANAVAGRNRKP